LILGTAQLVAEYGVTRDANVVRSLGEAERILICAAELGVKILDTAPAYGGAEEVIGSFDATFDIHTKLSYAIDFQQSLKNSLKDLNRTFIHVLYVHDLSVMNRDIDELDLELENLKNSGAREIGISIYEQSDLAEVLKIPSVSVVQVPLNVLDQRFADFVSSRKRRTIVRSTFLQGVLLSDPDSLPSKVQHLQNFVRKFQIEAKNQGFTPLEAALSFVRGSGASGIIVGCQNEDELKLIHQAWSKIGDFPSEFKLSPEFIFPPHKSTDPRNW
jgi:aryl-alcohol dehydrogenase-like predicted oxidoreductase